jgi:hypothetical protein
MMHTASSVRAYIDHGDICWGIIQFWSPAPAFEKLPHSVDFRTEFSM